MLVIKNKDKILGDTFVDGRFLCSNHRETTTMISFWFKDLQDKIPAGGVWVEINRNGHWNNIDKETYYNLSYPNIQASHQISADWFSDVDNARHTFEEALKQQRL